MRLNRLLDAGRARSLGDRRPAIAALVLALVLALLAGTSLAQAPQSAEGLTQSLVAQTLRYQAADPAQQAQLLPDLLTAAATRYQFLGSLVETDPGEVLRVALPGALRAGLPAPVQAYVEEAVQVEGDLEVLHEDRDVGSRYLYFLESALGRLSLHFAADAPALQTGTRVRVQGVRVGQTLALSSGGSVQTLSTVLPHSFGEVKTLVILVNFADKATQPYTVSSAQGVLATTSNFYLENSFSQSWLTAVVDSGQAADVRGWYTIALSSTVCDYSTLASQAKSAAQANGVDLSQYNRYVYAFPNNACTWWGLGTVGGWPGQSWINGSLQLRVVGHEGGHNYGLYHSHSMSCDSTTCTTSEYGDSWDIMGATSGHLNTFQKERLGWLNYGTSPPLTTVTADGTYWMDAYEPVGSNSKALKIVKSTDPSTGKKTYYYLEYRAKSGFDGGLSSGVVAHTGSESSANSSYTWDLFPTTSTTDWVLDVGQTYNDSNAAITMTTTQLTSSSAAVQVTFGPVPCVQANPSMALSPSTSQWVSGGTTVNYTVTVTNNDNAGCSASDFNLQATVYDSNNNVVSGWTIAFGSNSLTISPGSSGSTGLAVTSPKSATDGFYTIPVTATNSKYANETATVLATYVVANGLTVSVQFDKNPPAYGLGQTVTITATVTFVQKPVPNANVTFSITKPSGGKGKDQVTGTVSTNTNGVAVFQYKLKPKDATGTYVVNVHAYTNSVVFGDWTGSFTAQ